MGYTDLERLQMSQGNSRVVLEPFKVEHSLFVTFMLAMAEGRGLLADG